LRRSREVEEAVGVGVGSRSLEPRRRRLAAPGASVLGCLAGVPPLGWRCARAIAPSMEVALAAPGAPRRSEPGAMPSASRLFLRLRLVPAACCRSLSALARSSSERSASLRLQG